MTNPPRLIPQLSERYPATPVPMPTPTYGDIAPMPAYDDTPVPLPKYGTTRAAAVMRRDDRKSDAVAELIQALHDTPHPDPVTNTCLMLTLETLNRRSKR